MKHIINLENFKLNENLNTYKVGDYIILKYSSKIFKIIKIEHKWSNPYFLEYFNNNSLQNMNCRKEDIERSASPAEIEKYQIKIKINKYNL